MPEECRSDFHFPSNRMGYGCGDSFYFNFVPNGIPFGSKSKGNLSPQPYPIRFEGKWKYSFLSVPFKCEGISPHVTVFLLIMNRREFI